MIFRSLLLFATILHSICGYSQWQKSTIDTSYSLNAASYLNKDSMVVFNNGVLLQTNNGGSSFFKNNSFPTGSANYFVYKSRDSMYASMSLINSGLWATYDAGNTWFKFNLILPNGDTAFLKKRPLFFTFFDKNNGIILGDTLNGIWQVFLSQNGGKTWEHYFHSSMTVCQDLDLYNLYRIPYNHVVFENGVAKLLIGKENRLLTISDYGRLWQLDTISSREYYRIAFKDPMNGLASMNVPSGLARTTDGGITWTEVQDSARKSNGNLLYVKPTAKYPGFYLASTPKSAGESNISYDDGLTWQLFDTINHGSGTVFFKDAETGICSETLFPPLVSPIYYFKQNSVGLRKTEQFQLTNFFIYPNPSTGMVYLNQMFEQVSVTDIQGREVARYNQSSSLDISHLLTGMYWVKVVDENGATATQKLLVQH